MREKKRERVGIYSLVASCVAAVGVAGWLALNAGATDDRLEAPSVAFVGSDSPDFENDEAEVLIGVKTRVGSRIVERNGQMGVEYAVEASNETSGAIERVTLSLKIELEQGREVREHRIDLLGPGQASAVSGFVPIGAENAVQSAAAVASGYAHEGDVDGDVSIIFDDLKLVNEDGMTRLLGTVESNRADDIIGGIAEVVFYADGRIVTGQKVPLPFIPGISQVVIDVPLVGNIDTSWDVAAYHVE